MALANVFEPEKDRIVWDVGHQAYAWKIITGRDDAFATLRKLDGISGFPNPFESKADAAFAGHAGAALSTAIGFAAARDRKGTDEHVVAVVGDSALANGMSFEALNNCAASTKKLIVILNDNDMSISKPSGSFSKFLGRLITGVRYNRVKAAAEKAGHAMKLTFLRGIYHKVERAASSRSSLETPSSSSLVSVISVRSTDTIFGRWRPPSPSRGTISGRSSSMSSRRRARAMGLPSRIRRSGTASDLSPSTKVIRET